MPEKDFIEQVREMRSLQKQYFMLAGMARKNPAHWDEAREIVTKSKIMEAAVDEQLRRFGKEVES